MKLPKPFRRKKEPEVVMTEADVLDALYVPLLASPAVRIVPHYPSKWWMDWSAVSWL